MHKSNSFLSFIIFLFIYSSSFSQAKYDYYDGPYISAVDDNYRIQWIEDGKKKDSLIQTNRALKFEIDGLPSIDLTQLDFKIDSFQRHEGVSKIAALSDIHGQYQIFIDILKAQKIIDQDLKWNFDDGHLVIVGDIFDRGDKVTETLWFLFDLEKQAEKAGGKVHVLLGNHELMVLHNDVRYINGKYRYTSGSFSTPYPEFFGKNTVLGNWLRSKNIVAVINEIGFVHGGFSPRVIEKEKSLTTINQLFKEQIIDAKPAESDTLLNLLYFKNGPLWYRGYANPEGFDLAQANAILNTLNLSNIVVGHTSMPRIVSIHDNKILLVDSSMKFGKSAEILIYQFGYFHRGLLSGELIQMTKSQMNEESQSPFEYVLGLGDTDLLIELETDVSAFLNNKDKEEYQDATLMAIHNGEFNREWNVRVRSSGNMRKKVCKLPPMKIDFSKSTLDYLGFSKNDKLKLIIPCDKGKDFQQKLYKEFLIYKLYRELDTLGLQNHLVQVRLKQKGKIKYDVFGFFVEDEKDFIDRTGARIIKDGVLRKEALKRSSYLKMVFFQYMILNTDFGISNRHNLRMVAMPGEKIPICIPYDFDYAGIVGQEYAIPHESLNLGSVRNPLFRGANLKREEIAAMRDFFNSKRQAIETIIKTSELLNRTHRKGMITDIKRFYRDLNNEDEWEMIFIK